MICTVPDVRSKVYVHTTVLYTLLYDVVLLQYSFVYTEVRICHYIYLYYLTYYVPLGTVICTIAPT